MHGVVMRTSYEDLLEVESGFELAARATKLKQSAQGRLLKIDCYRRIAGSSANDIALLILNRLLCANATF
jgi:hypothetical protein